ncbi:hypothetical protein PTTG_07112, partial [Puccinia triticina 1-1 BBBD Race 1]
MAIKRKADVHQEALEVQLLAIDPASILDPLRREGQAAPRRLLQSPLRTTQPRRPHRPARRPRPPPDPIPPHPGHPRCPPYPLHFKLKLHCYHYHQHHYHHYYCIFNLRILV